MQEDDGPIKIGHSGDPLERLRSLQVGNPRVLTLLAAVHATRAAEAWLHLHLLIHLIRGEWYAPHPDVLEAIELYKEAFGQEEAA